MSNQDLTRGDGVRDVKRLPITFGHPDDFKPAPIVRMETGTKGQRHWRKLIRASKPRTNRFTISAQDSWLNRIKKERTILRSQKSRTS